MSGEMDAEVRNSIRAIQASVESLTKAQGRLNDTVRRYQQEAKDAFNQRPKLPVENTENFGRAVKEVGHALRYMHGPLAEISHRLTGGAGMEGGLGRIAVAAGLAGFALEALSAVTEKQTEDVKLATEAEEKYYQALEKGRAVKKQQAEAGLAQAPGRRKLLAAGGQEAVDAAENIAKNGGGVVTADEAERGTAEIYAKYGRTGRARSTLALANQLAQTGVGFEAAVQALLKAGGNVNDAASGQHIAAMIYQQKTGRVGNADTLFSEAQASVQGDPLLGAAKEAGGIRNEIRGVQRDRAIEDGPNAAREDLAAAKDPVIAAVREVQEANERQITALEAAAKQQGVIARLQANLAMLLGGKGSLENQAERAKRINAGASLGAGEKLNPEQ